jgi:hypothetical protein
VVVHVYALLIFDIVDAWLWSCPVSGVVLKTSTSDLNFRRWMNFNGFLLFMLLTSGVPILIYQQSALHTPNPDSVGYDLQIMHDPDDGALISVQALKYLHDLAPGSSWRRSLQAHCLG